MKTEIETLMAQARIVPVLEIERPEDAVPLARALVEGGLATIEVTLRTDTALASIERIARDVPECTLGVGSIRDGAMLNAARECGAQFGVSPGTSSALLDAIKSGGLPFLPGAATVSEAMTLWQAGFTFQKLFPASLLGGLAYLRAIGGPLPEVRFCPTGGITAETAEDYLALGNVIAVGGTWIAPRGAVAERDWAGITARARAAAERKTPD